MTGILLTSTALAAGVAALRQEAADAEPAMGQEIACAGLKMLHALLCCAEDVTLEPAPADAEATDDAADAAADDADDAAAEDAQDGADNPGSRARIWTAPRVAWAREHYADSTDNDQVLATLNAMPGDPIDSMMAVYLKASKLGIKRKSGLSRVTVWTEERNAVLMRGYPAGVRLKDLLEECSALPGARISGNQAVKMQARKLGLQRPEMPEEEFEAEAPPASEEAAPDASAEAEAKPALASFPPAHFRAPVAVANPSPEVAAQDEREAEGLIRANPDRWHGRAIAEEYGWPIEQAAAFVRRVRAAMAAERKGAAE